MGYSCVSGMAAGSINLHLTMKILLLANTAWYLYNFRLPLAKVLKSMGHEVILVSPFDKYSKRLEQAGFRWIEFPLSRKGMNPVREIASILKLFNLYKKEKPDLVHHFTIKCVLYGSLVAKWIKIRMIVNSITGLGYMFTGNSLAQRLLRPITILLYRIALGSTRVIFQNFDDCKQFLEYHLVSPIQTNIVRGSGVDTTEFPYSLIPEGLPLVVFPARMLWDKGVAEFIHAARILVSEGIKAEFILAGDIDKENPESVPTETIKKWQEEGLITWIGWQEDMPGVFASSSIVCLPSYYREGLPKALIEAASCGRPLVAFDAPGCREVVIHGKTGLLAKFRDLEDLTACLRTLINDPDLRQRMGKNARELVEREFSNEIIIHETLAVYSKLQGDLIPE